MSELRLQMEPGEILRSYRNAINKFQQVGILADLNAVGKKEMAIWLKEHGCGVDGRLLRDTKYRTPTVKAIERAAKEADEKKAMERAAKEADEKMKKEIESESKKDPVSEAPSVIQKDVTGEAPPAIVIPDNTELVAEAKRLLQKLESGEPVPTISPEIFALDPEAIAARMEAISETIAAQKEQEITLERAIDLLTECGWMQKHDMELTEAIRKSLEVKDENLGNQKAKADAGKPRLTLVPMRIIWDIAAVREWATRNKYPDPSSWKQVEPKRYHEALIRHVLRYIDEPDGVDKESGLPHLYHVATNVAFLAELEKERNKDRENGAD